MISINAPSATAIATIHLFPPAALLDAGARDVVAAAAMIDELSMTR